MSWASRRKFIIISSIAAVVVMILAVTTIAFLYETPTCSDGKQNADERGIDCGGSCAYQCLADVEKPVVRFARPIAVQPGRVDVIAYIDNKNPSLSAKGVRIAVELFDAERTSLGTKEVSIDIPAGATIPVYIPEAYRGGATVAQAFVTLEEESMRFYAPRARHAVPTVANVETENSGEPRIRAVLENPTAYPLYDIRPVVTVFDGGGNAIAASQTYLPQLGGQAEASIVFAWTRAFSGVPARIEVLPVVPLIEP